MRLVMCLCMLLWLLACTPQPSVEPPVIEEPVIEQAPFAQSPLLWVVDNHPEARPQDGLAQADIIYEVPVEGGLTRFLVLTGEASTGIMGPIRSARGFFALIAAEYNATLLHHGQSPSFPGAVMALGITHHDLTNANAEPIWRDPSRNAPHNLYSDIAQARAYVGRALYTGRSWPVAEGTQGNVSHITLRYPGGYSVDYRYGKSGVYERSSDGVKQEVVPRNIIVQQVSVRDGAEVSVDLLTTGTAYFFTQGRVHSGIWTKETPAGPTRFQDANGEEWRLSPGKTIIHIVPVLTAVQFR